VRRAVRAGRGGCLHPDEALSACDAGAVAVKIFPAGRLGPGYLSDLRSVLPDIPWVPTGGIHEDEVGAYLDPLTYLD
jgi:2-dehydro-3-deoxyphosphogluconate aldolase/(4S)-4-hydroxy-2-oxoglutarate aldolase